jgi:hypothetical protein
MENIDKVVYEYYLIRVPETPVNFSGFKLNSRTVSLYHPFSTK